MEEILICIILQPSQVSAAGGTTGTHPGPELHPSPQETRASTTRSETAAADGARL